MPADPRQLAWPGTAWLPLCVALLVLVALTTHPGITADTAGRADTAAIWLMLWAMAAGFSRGHGFSPVTGCRVG